MKEEPLSLSVVIPVYNEAVNIAETLRTLKENIDVPYETLIVYDFDEDNTLPVVRHLAGTHENLRALKNDVAAGPSGALRTGFREARGARVLVTMADRCDDLSQVRDLLSRVPVQADIACPSRYCQGGAQLLKPSPKVWIPRLAGWLLRHLCGIPTYDPTNSFKVYSAEVLRSIPLSSKASFSVTLELVAKAHCLGYRIVEVPTVWRDRQYGKSHFQFGGALWAYLPWFCVALLRNRLFTFPRSWLHLMLAGHLKTMEKTRAIHFL